jgi:CheY-like chemotaxis protein
MPYKVLVVDDDPEFLELMQSLLGSEGYQVAACAQSQLAYEHARALRPDAVTLDLRMPSPSGWEVLEQLECDAELRGTPILLISAAGAEMAETTGRLRDLGFPNVSVLVKPFEIDELLSRLAEAVVMTPPRR